jgi:hypothetical protein
MAVRVNEHQMVAWRCGCGTVTAGAAPDGVDAPMSYGPRIIQSTEAGAYIAEISVDATH